MKYLGYVEDVKIMDLKEVGALYSSGLKMETACFFKCWYLAASLHGVKPRNNDITIFTAVRVAKNWLTPFAATRSQLLVVEVLCCCCCCYREHQHKSRKFAPLKVAYNFTHFLCKLYRTSTSLLRTGSGARRRIV
jgi:hypothetical protein